MNKAILMGRLTKDPDLRTTPSQVSVATFTLAVDRRYKSASGDRPTDFINIVAWRGLADFVGNYCRKGIKLVVSGSIQTRTYDDKDGKKVYVTEIVTNNIMFLDTKKESGQAPVEEVKEETADPFADFGETIELSEEDVDFDVAF